jgi:hypothetical protein
MQVSPGTIPAGYCPTSEQNRLNLYASLLSITFPLTAGLFNFGNVVPIPDQQGLPWVRTNSDGTLDKLYVYANGAWLAPHPVPPSSPILFAYNGGSGGIASYDGGDGGAISSITTDSGPMWQIATTDGQAPATDGSNVIGYGQFLLGQSAAYPQGAAGGEINHTLLLPELPAASVAFGPGFRGNGTLFQFGVAGAGSITLMSSSTSSQNVNVTSTGAWQIVDALNAESGPGTVTIAQIQQSGSTSFFQTEYPTVLGATSLSGNFEWSHQLVNTGSPQTSNLTGSYIETILNF